MIIFLYHCGDYFRGVCVFRTYINTVLMYKFEYVHNNDVMCDIIILYIIFLIIPLNYTRTLKITAFPAHLFFHNV